MCIFVVQPPVYTLVEQTIFRGNGWSETLKTIRIWVEFRPVTWVQLSVPVVWAMGVTEHSVRIYSYNNTKQFNKVLWAAGSLDIQFIILYIPLDE